MYIQKKSHCFYFQFLNHNLIIIFIKYSPRECSRRFLDKTSHSIENENHLHDDFVEKFFIFLLFLFSFFVCINIIITPPFDRCDVPHANEILYTNLTSYTLSLGILLLL